MDWKGRGLSQPQPGGAQPISMARSSAAFDYRDAKQLFDQGDVDGLIAALDHPDVQRSHLLRGRLVRYLGNLMDRRAVPALVKVLHEDNSTPTRIFAAEGLGRIGDPRGLPPLREAAADPNRSVRLGAIRGLGDIRDRESVDRLVGCLNDDDSWIREYAAWALGAIGDQRATQALVKGTEDSNGRVRKAAALALVSLGDWNAIEPLREAHSRAGLFRGRVLGRALRELEDRFR